ncbi:hypothetical protein KCG48_03215 [Proteiniclasticum sp. BAD-10]|uniref:Uncharacterized protein n=1 Tax=Proteiniclasticum sediminis TaxID=2804028 RepID=A0A941CQ51_9CLOT|nr:hypothetical protein [Proteiniclasticum sediminis]MBR0575343.1 hypothetical protein [Proteiniclasticum sediminis]
MKKIIREIVNEDELARKKLEEAIAERDTIAAKLKEQGSSINDTYAKQAEETIQKRRDELNKEYEAKAATFEAEYQEALSKLMDKFDRQKEQWIETIYNNCLKA